MTLPIAYAIYGINASGEHYIYDVKVPADDEWQWDSDCLGEYWAGNVALGLVGDDAPQPKLVIAVRDHEKHRVIVASDEVIDGERLVCVAIEPREA